jgi:hypothetical protein
MQLRYLWIAATALLALAGTSLVLDRPPAAGQATKAKAVTRDEDKASEWMKGKLKNSRNILDGLTRQDFAVIALNAEGLEYSGYLEGRERASFPGYKEQLSAFLLANASLQRAARRKNLDGATLAYVQLTISCVECHKILRDAGQEK